jgi:hypothetical protein
MLPPLCASFVSIAEASLERLDEIDGDPDEENANDLEDDHSLSWFASGPSGPGCVISDAPEDNHDQEAIDEREPEEVL